MVPVKTQQALSFANALIELSDFLRIEQDDDAEAAVEAEAEALRVYERMSRMHPTSAEASHAYAFATLRSRDFSRASYLYETAASLQPESSHVLLGLGTALMEDGRKKEAIQAMRRATKAADASTAEGMGAMAAARLCELGACVDEKSGKK